MGPSSVRNLEIWKEGIQLVKEIYRITRTWPKEEVYGLTAQVRRAAISIPANISEGVGRASPGDTVRFVQMALGSAYELDTLLEIARELGFSTADEIAPLQTKIVQQCRQVSSFIRYQENHHNLKKPKPRGRA